MPKAPSVRAKKKLDANAEKIEKATRAGQNAATYAFTHAKPIVPSSMIVIQQLEKKNSTQEARAYAQGYQERYAALMRRSTPNSHASSEQNIAPKPQRSMPSSALNSNEIDAIESMRLLARMSISFIPGPFKTGVTTESNDPNNSRPNGPPIQYRF